MRKKIFWKIKAKENPWPVYAGMNLHTQPLSLRTWVGFQKPMKDKLSALMLRFGTNNTSSGSHFKSLFSQYKTIHGNFSRDRENPKGKPKIH